MTMWLFSVMIIPILLIMRDELKIPLRYINCDNDSPAFKVGGKNILVMVNCQYGTGNVKKLAADTIAIIDHHVKEIPEPPLSDRRPFLGSCSTLVWCLLCDAGFDFKNHLEAGTALYYGLYKDICLVISGTILQSAVMISKTHM